MAFKDWPSSGRGFAAYEYAEGIESDVEINVFRNGRAVTTSLPGARWVATIAVPDENVSNIVARRQLEALVATLRGGAVRLRIWNLLTPKPLGSLQTGTPLVASSLAAGGNSVALSGCNGTLLRGDRIQFGSSGQRVMVAEDAFPSGGNMTVAFEPMARAAVSGGVSIVYDMPWSSFVLREGSPLFPQRAATLPGFGLALVEGWE